ncbi:MAG: rhomboid family intramembrane serine protease [Flavobacteriaceae bacterium]|nr:rhomboid family intramembrane serine protease [Flavobacteriaceae bacterium]OUV85816.1 MAG: rhomboid family intramembrane serine protease [Flavobacteriaceae bacterium TMED145]
MNSVAIIIIGLNIFFSYKGFRDRIFFNKYKFSPMHIKSGEKIRYISSGFLHVDTTHLIVNMFTLYFFVDAVIFRVGEINFLIIYFTSLIFGNWLTYRFNSNNINYSAVGASGAVMGIVYSAILLNPDMTLFFFVLPMPGYLFGLGYLFYSIYSMKKVNDNIGHEAHLGGAIAGFFSTIFILPAVVLTNLFTVLILLVPIIYFYIKSK